MSKKICILGLGYVGLPTASLFATQGIQVLGVDTQAHIVTALQQRQIHIDEPGLDTIVKAALASGNLTASHHPEPADVFVIAVPTPCSVQGEHYHADMSYVKQAARSILPHLQAGNLVILESTSPIKTTEDLLIPILEESQLKIGEELFVAYCPERVLPGKILQEAITNARIIGGINAISAQKAADVYRSFVEGEIYLTTAATAEMCKLVENTYRDVNIALANELARISTKHEINISEVIYLANQHPRVHIHQPGPGVGGHCIPVDPWFIIEAEGQNAGLIHKARLINSQQPQWVVAQIQELLPSAPKKITLLGLTYKGNIDDMRGAPAIDVFHLLQSKYPHLNIKIYDPHLSQPSHYPLVGLEEAFADSDLAVVLVEHNEFKYLFPQPLAEIMRYPLIFDTKNCLAHDQWHKTGFEVKLLTAAYASTP